MQNNFTKQLKFRFLSLLLLFLSCYNSIAQNIYFAEPIQVVGSMNSYSTTIASNSLYRKISTNIGTPTDGRGHWVKTYNAQSSGGDVTNSNMLGGGGNGFLFISGPASNRFQNKWVFANIGLAKIDSTNTCSAYNAGNDMGLNMSNSGRYTFVFNDCGYTNLNARFYVGYTANTPVNLSNQSLVLGTNSTALVSFNTSANPSIGENLYIRYTSGADFSSTGTSTIIQASSSNSPINTTWTATIPSQTYGSTIRYYIFSSTLTLAKLNAMSEMDKSLACLQVLDNFGANYTYSFITKYNIQFKVDLSSNTCFGGFDSVTLTGSSSSISSWGNGIKLNNLPTTNVYGITWQIDSGSVLQYKYRFHKNGIVNWEGSFNTTTGNRELILNKDTVLGTPCFGSLTTSCPIIPAPSTISFLTDLSKTTPDPLGRVYVMGTFTNPAWSLGALRMFPVNGMPGYYQRIVTNVCPGTFDFKFVNGDSSSLLTPETFPNPLQRSCTVSNGVGGFNRTYTRPNNSPVNLYFVFDSCSNALPVNFLNFDGEQLNNGILLKWSTASEQNNKGFWVEKSDDGINFYQLVFVEGKGTSTTKCNYSFLDKNESKSISFYRLMQVDFDRNYEYSNSIQVKNSLISFKEFITYPNPFENELNIKIEQTGKYVVQIIDNQGKLMLKTEIELKESESTFVLKDLNILDNGIYVLQVIGNQEKINTRIIK
jgi:hypothetical protein